MSLGIKERIRLEKKAHDLRKLTVETVFNARSEHLGDSLSMMGLCTVPYHKVLDIDLANPQKADRDRFVMSKGHAGIGLTSVPADLGTGTKSRNRRS